MSRRLRCAIYTRKSSEEGLEQDFNSLQAQREACEAYIRSQVGEGWSLIQTPFDDGGWSGGNMERPALGALLAEVERGRVDVVVVYKVDRLTRSLVDFAKIVERFDAKGVSFVSVTQAFNTTTSMGRLTLNVLLSFAQFEREVTGERIRDKIAASKARGLWMGGNVPLGYDAVGRSLVANETEAELVRHIFRRYLALKSVHALKQELRRDGFVSKRRTTLAGREIGGAQFSRGALFHLLANRHYLGQIVHKEKSHPGQHPAIVDPDTFEQVQALLKAQAQARTGAARTPDYPLAGRIFALGGQRMSPATARGHTGRRYRYYVQSALQQGEPDAGSAAPRRLSANAVEQLVLERLTRLGSPDLAALRKLVIHDDRLEISVHRSGPRSAAELDRLSARLAGGDKLREDPDDEGCLLLTIAARPVLRGGRTWMVEPDGKSASYAAQPDRALIKALKRAHQHQRALNASPLSAPAELQRAQSAADSFIRRMTALAFLAPEIQAAILEGRQPAGLSLRRLMGTRIPLAWADQKALFGFS